uniref:Serine aminopeptidase S33 domain-containing protein n=1 Tax=Oryza glaberrima TaxID=4538 RepID=I1NMK9_ORYGL
MPDRSFKVPWKRALAVARPRSTMAPPRAATARELLRVCREVQSRFQEVELPLLVVHGGDDTLCDPECAEELHRRAGSEDKTLRVYPGMWHQLSASPRRTSTRCSATFSTGSSRTPPPRPARGSSSGSRSVRWSRVPRAWVSACDPSSMAGSSKYVRRCRVKRDLI